MRVDPATFVGPLEPLLGCRPWTRASEPEGREPCGVCRRTVTSDSFVCLGCLTVSPKNQRRLKAQCRRTDPKPDPKPKGDTLANLTRKERRWMIRNGMKTAEGRAWLEHIGLMPAPESL